MTDERGREPAADRPLPANPVAPAPEEGPPQTLSESPPRRAGAARQAATWLAVVLVIVIAGVILSPFWAPAVMPLLPWGAKTAVTHPVTHQDIAALAARVTVLEERPAPLPVDVGALKSAQAALAQRVDGVAATIDGLRQNQAATAEATKAVAQLAQRLDASDAKSASRAAATAADIVNVQRQLSQLGGLATDQGARLTALERRVQAQSGVDRNSTMLLMALLQMREAVEQARPFPADYDAFKRLAGNDPKLVAAAQPLAEAARDGVASRADLGRRLAALSTQVSAAARPATTSSSWWGEALDRMRRLVTIRRIDAAAKTGPEAAVGGAQQALASGDLAAAVSALNGLAGTDAEAARPWLKAARERLAAEAALTQLQGLVVAKLVAEPAAPPAMGTAPATPPATAPAPGKTAPAPPRAPS